jgi:amidase
VAVTTFITRLDAPGDGVRVAVKDLIDVAGVPTTVGCRAVADSALPAEHDAPLLAGFRAAGARLVGKANLHELAMSPTGTNPWFGTPENPFDPTLVPGGSSSGSAVAVATDEADIALGSDTGGSIRIPSACCGTVGLKTTYGRVNVEGTWPLAASFDTIGPMARTVDQVIEGMGLLEPGFALGAPVQTVGRISTDADPRIESAIDEALRQAGLEVVPLDVPDLHAADAQWVAVFLHELWVVDGPLMAVNPGGIGDDVRGVIAAGANYSDDPIEARRQLKEWRTKMIGLFDRVELLALPTMPIFPPTIAEALDERDEVVGQMTHHTRIFNALGTPCTAQPVPTPGSAVPASLQLVGPHMGEEALLATARQVEIALA